MIHTYSMLEVSSYEKIDLLYIKRLSTVCDHYSKRVLVLLQQTISVRIASTNNQLEKASIALTHVYL